MTEFLTTHITELLSQLGYLGVFVFMAMESMVFPVPSEAVMPPAGMLIAQGRMSVMGVLLASSLGSIVGSLLSYAIGQYGGRPFIDRFGKYMLLSHEDLETTEHYFNKYGSVTVFVCRFIPVIRHLISIPAGLAKMPIGLFVVLTVAGATTWNMFLAWAGVVWQAHWNQIMAYRHVIDRIVGVGLLVLIGYFVVKHLKK